MKNVFITGATGQIAYDLVFRVANGDLFSNPEPLAIHLYDIPGTEKGLEGLAMELDDCAFPLLKKLQFGTQLEPLCAGVDLALLVGAKPRGPGMERGELLRDNGQIFVKQGKALNDYASRDVKVLVVGNPCNTNCFIAMQNAPNLPRKNFHAMMRLDQNRACSQLAKKAGVEVSSVTRMTIWGNHSKTQIPDFTHARIGNLPAQDVIQDKAWLENDFLQIIQDRGSAIIKARGKSSIGSAANAIIDAVKSLYVPTPEGQWFTSAVCSDDNPYGIEKGLIFGFPCRSNGKGDYTIVPELAWNPFIQEKIAITQKELISEREFVEKL